MINTERIVAAIMLAVLFYGLYEGTVFRINKNRDDHSMAIDIHAIRQVMER